MLLEDMESSGNFAIWLILTYMNKIYFWFLPVKAFRFFFLNAKFIPFTCGQTLEHEYCNLLNYSVQWAIIDEEWVLCNKTLR